VIGLTDTLYVQTHMAVEQLGATAQALVTEETMAEYFSGIPVRDDLSTPAAIAGYFEGQEAPSGDIDFQVGLKVLELIDDRPDLAKKLWFVPEYDPEMVGGSAAEDPELAASGGEQGEIWLDLYVRNRPSFIAPTDRRFLSRLINMDVVKAKMEALDGLLIGGGQDVNPLIYADENDGSGSLHRTRDIIELAFISEALEQDKPILGICRGSQILAVALGERLIQDLPTRYPGMEKRHSMPNELEKSAGHSVRVTSARLARILGLGDLDPAQGSEPIINVNSYHHQAVDPGATHVEVGAWDNEDGPATAVVEGFVTDEPHFVVGVQWHPERPRATSDELPAMFIDDEEAMFPRGHDRAVFESFMTCVADPEGRPCRSYLSPSVAP
jgi:gamma-glutamyl-gamma-aminobutyrate hydrolase PuuD